MDKLKVQDFFKLGHVAYAEGYRLKNKKKNAHFNHKSMEISSIHHYTIVRYKIPICKIKSTMFLSNPMDPCEKCGLFPMKYIKIEIMYP